MNAKNKDRGRKCYRIRLKFVKTFRYPLQSSHHQNKLYITGSIWMFFQMRRL